ncbi:oligosaccharide flippase family protein [Patescibacteria group bacterium]|nr:oligosaccharide flippase family protein [Patescibacteria group bacterium]MBU4367627.1 oligosaccharide flippase family protein [Patescibacteria group bacterium]MBU4462107.1 oligosaccharide flippase family protein [Patescibacteria group bacterium]MCG2700426.1 oligosaccharide flippase family protein [Candidatus Parcubacteria bacterium]
MFNKVFQDNFLKYNFIFFCGSMVVAVFNYLYHPILSRMMDIESFGEVQTIISLFLLFSMVIGVFRTIVVNIVTNAQEIKEKQELILMLQKAGLYIVSAFSLSIILFSPQLKSFFNFHSVHPFISLAVLLVLSLFFTFRSAILQALHKFKEVSIANIYLSAGRLIFAVLLVYIGWASFGAITAIVLSQILALIYVYLKTGDHLMSLMKAKVKITSRIKKELSYALLVFSATLCVTFLYSADVIIVKHYFAADQAGFYSGIATIARILFFSTASVAGVLISFIKLENSKKENKKILKKSLFLVGGLGGAVLLTFLLVPAIVIKVLIGQRYLVYANLLPRLSLLLFAVSIINVLFFYYLALRKYFLAIIAVLSPLLVLILSYFRHDSLLQIINNFLWASILILIILSLRFLWQFLNIRQNKIYE